MTEHINVNTVSGRQALIAKIEDMNAAVHQLDLLVTNMERDLAQREELLAELELLRREHGVAMDCRHRQLETLFKLIWVDGNSIYDKAVQALVEELLQ